MVARQVAKKTLRETTRCLWISEGPLPAYLGWEWRQGRHPEKD